MRCLLDTNIVSDLVRHPQGRVMRRIREVGEAQVCTSIIVAAELRYGATKKGSPRLVAQLEAVRPRGRALRDTRRCHLRPDPCPSRRSRPVDRCNDLLIAAQAVPLRYTIITDNEREFARIDDLARENWLRDA